MATIATTIAHHITGVTCFELPLRGESLAAWLNSCFMEPRLQDKAVDDAKLRHRQFIETPPSPCPTARRFPDRHHVSTTPVARRSPDRRPGNYPSVRPRVSHG